MRRRSGFTLVEVLVAMALILFIMSILAGAFGAATSAVSDLKAAGDLAERLRGAANVLKRDLAQDHFTASTASGPRLSDSNFWSRLVPGNPNPPTPGPPGFLRIMEAAIPGTAQGAFDEGVDLDNIHSFRATRTALHYTVGLHGTRRSDFLSAGVPVGSPLTTPQTPIPSAMDFLLGPADTRYQDTVFPNYSIYNSQFAEVAVFLARIPSYDTTDSSNGLAPLPLYALYRRQFLAVPAGWSANPPVNNDPSQPATPTHNLEMSARPTAGESPAVTPLTFNSMTDLNQPVNRFWMNRTAQEGAYLPVPVPVNPAPPAGFDATEYSRYETMGESNGNFQNGDLLLTDVVSFDVRVLAYGIDVNGNVINKNPDFVDLFDPSLTQYSGNNPAFIGANTPRVFDTWSNQGAYSTWDGPWRTPALPATAATIPLYKTTGANPQTISIKAIQITLRVWDFKTKKTRQMTIVQEM